MKVGLVCPYTWDVPGGVQAHVRDLAVALLAMGYDVSVLAPADDDADLPPYVVSAGKAVSVPYNGSVARLAFGPRTATAVRRWLRDGDFDVLHIHEPLAPSTSLFALWAARCPVVATFHASVLRSRTLLMAQPALAPALEKIHARIAVSAAARRYIVEHMGGSCLLIPNGVDVARFATAEPLAGWPRPGGTIGFLGRIDEPRKGLPVLLDAFGRLVQQRPGTTLLVAGPGDQDEIRESIDGAWADHVTFLGMISDADKPRFYRSVDVYCAPNTGGESFGVVLLEAMAAGTPVVASDLDAFARVLDGCGVLVPPDDAAALAHALTGLLDDVPERDRLVGDGRTAVARYDWAQVAADIAGVYETVVAARV